MWQSLHASLKDRNFTVVTVAMDEPEAARPWIEAAKPTYPCLIDRNHHVAELYNMVNVPQAIWIDEQGRSCGRRRTPARRMRSDSMDRTTKQMSPEQIAERDRTKQTYVAAVRDWVLKGSASEFAYDAAQAPRPAAAPRRPLIAGRMRIFGSPILFLSMAKREEAAAFRRGQPAASETPGLFGVRRQKRMRRVWRPAQSSGRASIPSATAPTTVPLI